MAQNFALDMNILVMYPRLIQGKLVSPRLIPNTRWTLWWVVVHRTNEKYTPIMASSIKIQKDIYPTLVQKQKVTFQDLSLLNHNKI